MDILREILSRGGAVPSFCTASELALEAAMECAARLKLPALVEATANQVSQFGGYTGMTPRDFAAFAREIAARAGLADEMLILGGDHLGPLPWQNEDEDSAMEKAEQLVRLYAAAGFSKLHLDTSMWLKSDGPHAPLSVQTVARRGARLARAALGEWRGTHPPAFIIGSEVPVPGGAADNGDTLTPTSPEDFEKTVDTYRRVFADEGLTDAWNCVVAVVVQPGVEFSGDAVYEYNAARAQPLTQSLKKHPNLAFEGHSTDYQSLESLCALTRGGVKILKVGPELTFALRQALFALSFIEDALLEPRERAGFADALERAMLENPKHWNKYYHGTECEQRAARQYSLSDRCRYYLSVPEVAAAQQKLFENIDRLDNIPAGMLRQFLPGAAGLKLSVREMVKEHIRAAVLGRYFKAAT